MTVRVRERTIRSLRPVDLRLTLAPLRHGGARDHRMQMGEGDVVRAMHTADGPATLHLRSVDAKTILARCVGAGRSARARRRAGSRRRRRRSAAARTGAPTRHPARAAAPRAPHRPQRLGVRRAGARGVGAAGHRGRSELRVPLDGSRRGAARTRSVESRRPRLARAAPAARARVAAHGGVVGVPSLGCRSPSHGDDQGRRRHAPRLDETARMPVASARQRLAALPGVGPWTVNAVAMLALGDADAVNVGDYWLKHVVTLRAHRRGARHRRAHARAARTVARSARTGLSPALERRAAPAALRTPPSAAQARAPLTSGRVDVGRSRPADEEPVQGGGRRLCPQHRRARDHRVEGFERGIAGSDVVFVARANDVE